MEICRENAGPVFQGKHFVRACAVKMHMDMSQEAFCVMSPTHYYHNFSVDANVGQIRQHVGENGHSSMVSPCQVAAKVVALLARASD